MEVVRNAGARTVGPDRYLWLRVRCHSLTDQLDKRLRTEGRDTELLTQLPEGPE